MTRADTATFDEQWLALREPADAAARSGQLLDALRAHLRPSATAGRAADPTTVVGGTAGATTAARRPLHILDLGSGTGSTTRWLAPQLAGPQHWTLLDHDGALLRIADQRCAGVRAADGAPTTVRTTVGDVAALSDDDLTGTALVTASALLDLLTRRHVDLIAAACAAAGTAALLTLSVAGEVALDPVHPLDQRIAAAFDAHQRREVDGWTLLGPNAAAVAGEAFRAHGYDVRLADSPWRLGPSSRVLIRAWLDGWLAAAAEQDPTLAPVVGDYRRRRLHQLAADELHVAVHHRDLLALPTDHAAARDSPA